MKLLMTIMTMAVLGTSAMAISRFDIKPDNCDAWMSQGMFNAKKLWEGNGKNDAQYQASMIALKAYELCVSKRESGMLTAQLKVITQELQMIKSVLITKKEIEEERPTDTGIPPAFDTSMGDYQ